MERPNKTRSVGMCAASGDLQDPLVLGNARGRSVQSTDHRGAVWI